MESENEAQNRADDFTEDEMDILIQEATQRREIKNAKLGGNITKLRKQMEWERIATAVTTVSASIISAEVRGKEEKRCSEKRALQDGWRACSQTSYPEGTSTF